MMRLKSPHRPLSNDGIEASVGGEQLCCDVAFILMELHPAGVPKKLCSTADGDPGNGTRQKGEELLWPCRFLLEVALGLVP